MDGNLQLNFAVAKFNGY